jgi:hypothetical protein
MKDSKSPIKITMCRCEKIPEKEFDAYHGPLSENWQEMWRKNGFVYVGYRADKLLKEINHDQGR